jgi:hypothetical protein
MIVFRKLRLFAVNHGPMLRKTSLMGMGVLMLLRCMIRRPQTPKFKGHLFVDGWRDFLVKDVGLLVVLCVLE